MANLRNESKFYKNAPKQKEAQNNLGGKPKKRPKRLANLRNESKLHQKIHQNKKRLKGKTPKRGPKQL